MLRKFPSIPILLRVLIINGCQISSYFVHFLKIDCFSSIRKDLFISRTQVLYQIVVWYIFSPRCVLPFNFPFNVNCDFQRVQNFNFNAVIFFVFKVHALFVLFKKSLPNSSSQILFSKFSFFILLGSCLFA